MSPFTLDAAARLPGPESLRQRRIAAAERLRDLPWPTVDDEVWRYSRIGELDLERFSPADDAVAAPSLEGLPYVAEQRCGLVVTVDGAVAHLEQGGGVTITVNPDVATGNGALVDDAAGNVTAGNDVAVSAPTAPEDWFAVLNEAFARDVVVVEVPRGLSPAAPLVVVHLTRSDGRATFPRLVVRAAQGSHLQLVEVLVGDAEALVCPVVELHAARDATIGYLAVHDLGPRAWQVANQVAEAGPQATVTAATAAFGGDYARLRTDCRLAGAGSAAKLMALYFGDGHQMLDFRTFQDHQGPDTTSDLLFKGAVDDHAHAVYTGLIRVRPSARGTNAFQTNRNIKLSEHAWAESVPNLEIENNDVRCSHASTVGPIDLDQRFYLESRGVPPQVADRLILTGFFDEVIGRLPIPSLGADLRRRVAAKLRHRLGAPSASPAGGAAAPGSLEVVS